MSSYKKSRVYDELLDLIGRASTHFDMPQIAITTIELPYFEIGILKQSMYKHYIGLNFLLRGNAPGIRKYTGFYARHKSHCLRIFEI